MGIDISLWYLVDKIKVGPLGHIGRYGYLRQTFPPFDGFKRQSSVKIQKWSIYIIRLNKRLQKHKTDTQFPKKKKKKKKRKTKN